MERQSKSVVVMGVSGCGKSTLAATLAAALRWTLIEGDNYHSNENRQKMKAGIALTDHDRIAWLTALGGELQLHDDGAILTCSALKLAYRDMLRAAVPDLRFVFLRIDEAHARARVASRVSQHTFPPSLVASQFETLEVPSAEPRVLTVDALLPVKNLSMRVITWLKSDEKI